MQKVASRWPDWWKLSSRRTRRRGPAWLQWPRPLLGFLTSLPALVRVAGGVSPALRGIRRAAVGGVEDYMRTCFVLPDRETPESEGQVSAAPGPLPLARLDRAPSRTGYVILAPNFATKFAGVRCLYLLCDRLNQRGYPAFVTWSRQTAPHLNAPILAMPQARALVAEKGWIAIYPEVVPGNPLGAKRVARWVLNRPGLLGGDKEYGPEELVFYYANAFRKFITNTVQGKLLLPAVDQSLFYPGAGNPQRSLECFYIGKSQWQDGLFDRNRVFEIARDSPRRSELGKLFRAARYLYSFDNCTALVDEARMCGCPVVLIPDGTIERGDFERSEFGTEGIAWGMAEREVASANAELFHRRYDDMVVEFESQLDTFIRITQGGA